MEIDWRFLYQGEFELAFEKLYDVLMTILKQHIPMGTIQEIISTHPWLNKTCEDAIAQKNASEGTSSFIEASCACSAVLAAAYSDYTRKLREEIAKLPKDDKRWWALNRELLQRRARISGVPL